MSYRAVTFKSVYERILRLMEYDPATWPGSAGQQELVADLATQALREAWHNAIWSSIRSLEERTVETDADDNKYIPFAETGLDTIDHVFAITRSDPRANKAPMELHFWVSARGFEVARLAPATAFVQYRVRPPQLTRVAYSGATTYAEGDLVYDATSGDCYRSLVGSNTGNAVSSATHWERQRIPEFLSEYVRRATFAELLRNDGRGDRADIEAGRAFSELERTLIAEESQQQQEPQLRIHLTR
jgi:hypothetical protein